MANIKKNAQGYGYKYTDLAEIHNYLESQGITYRQYIEPIDGVDYIMTQPCVEGEALDPVRGCRVVEAKLSGKSNPAQEYGAALTYCRRYSLLMAFGLATTDDDAASLTQPEHADSSPQDELDDMPAKIRELAKQKGVQEIEICNQGGVTRIEDMHPSQMQACLNWLGGM